MMYSALGYQWDGTVQLFGTKGQAKNLAKGQDGPGQLESGTGRAGTAKIRDGTCTVNK